MNKNNNQKTSDDIDIKVVGCGGSGNNMINKMYNMNLDTIETIAIDTDRKHLNNIDANKKILIGSEITKGQSTEGNVKKGRSATEEARETIREAINTPDIVFVIGGLGGGTGTGSIPVVCNISRNLNATTISILSIPFRSEKARLNRARNGVEKVNKNSDTLVLLDNEKLSEYETQLPIGQLFSLMDQIVCDTIKGISETLKKQSLVNLDYEKFENITSDGSLSTVFIGDSKNYDNFNPADEIFENPLVNTGNENFDKGIIYITCGTDLSDNDVHNISNKTLEHIDTNNATFSASVRKDYDSELKVITLLTGINSEKIFKESNSKYNENTPKNSNIDISDSDIDSID